MGAEREEERGKGNRRGKNGKKRDERGCVVAV